MKLAFWRKGPTVEQTIERVSSRIAPTILEFCKERAGQTFHAEDLHRYVEQKTGRLAPASADRILRSLRSSKQVEYRVVDRHRSLYEVTNAAS